MFLIVVPLLLFVLLKNRGRKWVLKHIHILEAECFGEEHIRFV